MSTAEDLVNDNLIGRLQRIGALTDRIDARYCSGKVPQSLIREWLSEIQKDVSILGTSREASYVPTKEWTPWDRIVVVAYIADEMSLVEEDLPYEVVSTWISRLRMVITERSERLECQRGYVTGSFAC